MRDLFSNIGAVQAIAPAVQSAAVNGAAIDLKGVGRIAFVVNTGAIAGSGDFGLKLQDSDDGTTFADAPEGRADSDAPATLEAASVYRLGYRGWRRYVRLVLTKEGGTSIAAGAVAVLGSVADRPVA